MRTKIKQTAGGENVGKADAGLDKPLLLDVNQVAVLLNCSPRHVYRMSEAGKLPRPMKLGALVRWNRSAIEQFVAGPIQGEK